MWLRSLAVLLTGSVLLGAADPPSTCIFVPPLLHRVDVGLRAQDARPPDRPLVVSVDAFRRNGMTCTRASCVQNSCGDTGTIRIELAPAADDATPPDELGFRLTLVRGQLPPSLRDAVGVTLAAGRPLYLRPAFEELPTLDIELAAVAVDAAGNESEPTPPFAVRFDGCTLAAVGDWCEDELDPDTDLSGVIDGESEGEVAGPSALSTSCALGPRHRGGSLPALCLLAAALLGRWLRRRAAPARGACG